MVNAALPTDAEVFGALRVVGRLLEREWVYLHDGVYHFTLGDGWSLGVAPESAERLRLEVWRGGKSTGTIWTPVEDRARLEVAVEHLGSEVLASVA